MTSSGITGGTPGYITEFNPVGNGIVPSTIFQLGSNIGVGTITPVTSLDVAGSMRIADGSQ